MKNKTSEIGPELSRPLSVDKIPPSGLKETIIASDKERQQLMERFGLLDLPVLKAELTVHPMKLDQTVDVTGKITADVVQQCVVTLEPLPAHIEHDLEVVFSGEAEGAGAGPSDAHEEDVETIVNGSIDLGELVAQHLGIALDPYPRKAGVAFVEAEYGDIEAPQGGLAQLANWGKKPKDSR